MKQQSMRDDPRIVLFFPIFFAATCSNLLDCVSILLDEMIIGNLFDDAAFGAINMIEPFLMTESFLGYLICIGGVALIIRADGQKSYDLIDTIFSHCVTSCLLLGGICFAVYTIFENQMAQMVSNGTEAMPYVLQAISWNRLDALVEPLYIFLFSYVLLRGGSFYALAVTILEIASNCLLSVVLGRTMGIGGVVFATGLAYCIGIVLIVLYFLLKKEQINVKLGFIPAFAKEITVISFPEGSYVLSLALMEAVINQIGIRNYGIKGIAVAAVVINVYEIVIYVSEGISQYETAALNEYLGQGNRELVSKCIRTTVRAACIEGLVISVLYYGLAKEVVSIFDINDPATCLAAETAVRLVAIIPIVICFTRILAIFYQYTNRVRRASFLIIMSWGFLPALFGWLFGKISLNGLTVGVIVGSTLALLFMILYVTVLKKEKLMEYQEQVSHNV
ncbi:MAG: hypothetical protein K6G07_00060 [Lachnospiraceae bacterium]|nr:hypothetical protein [Lachnospiraceae bacterium]